MQELIRIRGARQHHLKNISLDLPKNALIVITGPSGSGKSSLAFDTLFAEETRRYMQSLSSYARQFLEQLEKPEVDSIEGLSPAIAIEQRSSYLTLARLLQRQLKSTITCACSMPAAASVTTRKQASPCVGGQPMKIVDHILAHARSNASFLVLAPLVRAQRNAPRAVGTIVQARVCPRAHRWSHLSSRRTSEIQTRSSA